ncbi:hypothetical protein HDV05_006458 [Chytridiales sp. JEL 0842]|nr:hypothetical protein HDV05_006458 [Chytridiales sp. JEL 0842]
MEGAVDGPEEEDEAEDGSPVVVRFDGACTDDAAADDDDADADADADEAEADAATAAACLNVNGTALVDSANLLFLSSISAALGTLNISFGYNSLTNFKRQQQPRSPNIDFNKIKMMQQLMNAPSFHAVHAIQPPQTPIMVFVYSCNLTSYAPIPIPSVSLPHPQSHTLPSTLLYKAALYSSAPPGLASTLYTHQSYINGSSGRYETDCSCYISFLLSSMHLYPQLHQIPLDTHPTVKPPAPRARSYFEFMDSLKRKENEWWEAVDVLENARAGDVLGWIVPTTTGDTDTGHTMVLIEPKYVLETRGGWLGSEQDDFGKGLRGGSPLLRINETAFLVGVADASGLRHENDSRCALVSDSEGGAPKYKCRHGTTFVKWKEDVCMHIDVEGLPKGLTHITTIATPTTAATNNLTAIAITAGPATLATPATTIEFELYSMFSFVERQAPTPTHQAYSVLTDYLVVKQQIAKAISVISVARPGPTSSTSTTPRHRPISPIRPFLLLHALKRLLDFKLSSLHDKVLVDSVNFESHSTEEAVSMAEHMSN